MSAGPIPFLTPADLSFTPGNPDFTDMVASELGNLGTDADGFLTLLDEATTLAGDAPNILASFDGDLADVGTTLAALNALDPANDQAGLVSTAAAIDAALNDYNGQLPPQPNPGTGGSTGTGARCAPGTVINGVTIGQPDPTPLPPAPGAPHLNFQTVLNAMCLNDPTQDIVIASATITDDGSSWQSSKIWVQDTTIFHTYATERNRLGNSYLRDNHLQVTPSKAGRFSFVIQFFTPDNLQGSVYQFDVTIVKGP